MGNTLSAYQETETVLDVGPKGLIKGVQLDAKARRYLGIPYALPPTGPHRWLKPRPLPGSHTYSSSETPYDATSFRSICPQPLTYTTAVKHLPTTNVYSEDCLFLNIWTPVPTLEDEKRKMKWPVMLWLHGGWFQMGEPSHEPGMDPTELISAGKLNAIVVAIGYRLNVFGFLAGDALVEEGNGEAGNYGLWDQRMAIEWVKENIGFFGGDAGNVTLAGRSAGAYSVQAQTLFEFQSRTEHMNNEESTPFHRLVMISNAIPTQPKSVHECQEQFDELCSHFSILVSISGQEKLALLREIDATTLTQAIMKLKHHTFRPVTDNSFIQPGITEYHRSGFFAAEFKRRNFKLLIGEVLNEETLYSVTNGPEPNLESLKLQVGNYYASNTTDRVLEHYTLPESDEKKEWGTLFGNVIADGQVRAPSRFLANSLNTHGVPIEDIWRYRIACRLSFITEKVAPKGFGVAHAMDKPFWNFSIMHGPTEKERVLMQDWISDLAAFVEGSAGYEYGTKEIDEFKVATSNGRIEIQKDERWSKLLRLAGVFAG